jgi:hypothetical protein
MFDQCLGLNTVYACSYMYKLCYLKGTIKTMQKDYFRVLKDNKSSSGRKSLDIIITYVGRPDTWAPQCFRTVGVLIGRARFLVSFYDDMSPFLFRG